MKQSFADHICAIGGNLGHNLLGESGKRALLSICSLFPFDMAADFGFESRLSLPEAECDFFFLLRKDSAGARIMAGEHPFASLSPELVCNPFWQKLSALFREWNRPDSFLNLHIKSFWLEFDYHEGVFNRLPNLFFQVTEATDPENARSWNKSLETSLDQVYRILFGIGFPADLAATMRRCVEALPGNAMLYQTGFMIPRKTEAIRLVVSRLSGGDVSDYLQRVGWPGNTDEVGDLLKTYGSSILYAFYDLTIGSSLLPTLGTELFLRVSSQPQWDPGWHRVFDLMQSDGLIHEGKREDLLKFCGKQTVTHLFPVTYYHGINHVKLVSCEGKKRECKAYFGTMIRTRDDQGVIP